MIFSGSLNAEGFEGWLEFHLLPSLKEPSVFIMDNAPIHRKGRIRKLLEAHEHAVLFLPRYSPDLNDIEHDFAAIKKLRAYDTTGKTLDEIIKPVFRTNHYRTKNKAESRLRIAKIKSTKNTN